MNTQKIWLDTDIGSDIDDALALALLLSRPDCEILGISTVTEVDAARAKLASVLCRVAQKEVPIFPGTRHSFLVSAPQKEVQQRGALDKWPHDSDFPAPAFAAIEAARAAIRSNPGEVTLLGIGPMTNIALLFAVDPEIPALLKQLVVMCGTFATLSSQNGREWNALNDPHATAMLYDAPVVRHISIGLDVTERVILERADFEQRLSQSIFGPPITDMAASWFRHAPRVTFHDPLAAAVIFEPDLCVYQSGQVEVETCSEMLRGHTRWHAREDGPHQIALEVDAEKFYQSYFGALLK